MLCIIKHNIQNGVYVTLNELELEYMHLNFYFTEILHINIFLTITCT